MMSHLEEYEFLQRFPLIIPHPNYKGVHNICGISWGKWIAELGGQFIGIFNTAEAAALAYDRAALEEQGSRADLNAPEFIHLNAPEFIQPLMLVINFPERETNAITFEQYGTEGLMIEGRKMGGSSPRAAHKLRRSPLTGDCVSAPYFPPDDPQRLGKKLQERPVHLGLDVLSSLVYEASARMRDPEYGFVGSSSSSDHVIDIPQDHVIDIPQLEEEQGRCKKLGKRLRSRINNRIKDLPKELYLALLPVAGQFLYQNVSSPVQDAITKDILVLANGLGFLLLLGGMLGLTRRWKHAYLVTLLGLLFTAAGIIFSMSVAITGAPAWAARAVSVVGFLAVLAALIC